MNYDWSNNFKSFRNFRGDLHSSRGPKSRYGWSWNDQKHVGIETNDKLMEFNHDLKIFYISNKNVQYEKNQNLQKISLTKCMNGSSSQGLW